MSRHPDPRIDRLQQNVREQIRGHDDQRDIDDERLDQRKIPGRDGRDQQPADSRNAEDLLDHDAAGKNLREDHPEKRDHLRERVFQDVAVKHGVVAVALAVSRAHIIEAHLSDHRGAQKFRDGRDAGQRDGERRVKQIGEKAGGAGAEIHVAARGEKLQQNPEHPDEKNPQKKIRDGNVDHRDGVQNPVERRVPLFRAVNAEGDRNRDDQQKGDAREGRRHREPLGDQLFRRNGILDGVTGVPGQQAAHPFQVADGERIIQPELRAEDGNPLGRGLRPQDQRGGVPRYDVESGEGQQRHQQQSQQQCQNPSDQMSHVFLPPVGFPVFGKDAENRPPASAQTDGFHARLPYLDRYRGEASNT